MVGKQIATAGIALRCHTHKMSKVYLMPFHYTLKHLSVDLVYVGHHCIAMGTGERV